MTNIKKYEKVRYACGMNPSTVKKMCVFLFGEYVHSVKVNIKTKDFEIYMHKELNGITFEEKHTKEFIDYFLEFWGEKPGFKIVYYLGIKIEDYF